MKLANNNVLDGIDIRLMADKGLCGLAASNIPKLGGGITSARDENVLVWSEGQTT